MSHKHFEALARALYESRPGPLAYIRTLGKARSRPTGDTAELIWRDLIDAVANICADANPHFNRTRFIDAATNGKEAR